MTSTPLARLFCFLAFATSCFATHYDIPAQSAADALATFRTQSKVQLVYNETDLKAVRSSALQGDFEPALALSVLLQGTGYLADERKPNWFVIVAEKTLKPGSIEGSVRDESGRPVAKAMVEIEGTEKAVQTDKRGNFSFAEVRPGSQALLITADGLRKTRVTDIMVHAGHSLSLSAITLPGQPAGVMQLDTYTVSAKKNDGAIELDPYQVSGEKEKPFAGANVDVPRTINDAQPYYIFDNKTIDQSGSVNVETFLKQFLTMNTVAATNAQLTGGGQGNTSSINLRGLGTDKTLVLVNGRKMSSVTTTFGGLQPDLNGIPLAAVERIEVLPSSASGIYGGSAIGGVVNVVLKQKYSGGDIRLSYDNTFDTDSAARSITGSYGFSLEGGKTQVMLSASARDSNAMMLQDRIAVFSENLNRIQTNSPNFLVISTRPWLGAVPNLISPSGTLVLKNGTSLNSTITHISPGLSPADPQSALLASVIANAGTWDYSFPATSQAPNGVTRLLTQTPKIKTFAASIRRQMAPWLELFVDTSYYGNRSISTVNPVLTNQFVLQPTNPFSPFTTSVTFSLPYAGNTPNLSNSITRSATIGSILKLPNNWTGEIDYTRSQNTATNVRYELDLTAFRADLAAGLFNPLVDLLKYPLALDKYFIYEPTSFESKLDDYAFRATGPLPALPWGTPNLAVGIETAITKSPENQVSLIYQIPANTQIAYYYPRKSQNSDAYAEIAVPIIKSDRFPGIHSLDFQAAGRFDRFDVDTGTQSRTEKPNATPPSVSYSGPTNNGKPVFSRTSYDAKNYTLGIKYEPTHDLTIRASRASAFLPPTPAQLAPADQLPTTPSVIIDPRTGSQTSVQVVSGGNPGLKPQSSKSTNVGLIWQPTQKLFQGLRIDVEYYNIEQFQAISAISAQSIVNNESAFSSRVTRDVNGTITKVDATNLNLFHRETEGYDVSVDYSRPTSVGTFGVHAVESYISKLRTQFVLTAPEYDAAGYAPLDNGSPRYKTTMSLFWESKQWAASWTVSAISSYKQSGTPGSPSAAQSVASGFQPNTTYIIAQGSDHVESQSYSDVFLGYTFAPRKHFARLLANVRVNVGVRNIFNKVPSFDVVTTNAANGFVSPYGDLRLRSYWVEIKKSF